MEHGCWSASIPRSEWPAAVESQIAKTIVPPPACRFAGLWVRCRESTGRVTDGEGDGRGTSEHGVGSHLKRSRPLRSIPHGVDAAFTCKAYDCILGHGRVQKTQEFDCKSLMDGNLWGYVQEASLIPIYMASRSLLVVLCFGSPGT